MLDSTFAKPLWPTLLIQCQHPLLGRFRFRHGLCFRLPEVRNVDPILLTPNLVIANSLLYGAGAELFGFRAVVIYGHLAMLRCLSREPAPWFLNDTSDLQIRGPLHLESKIEHSGARFGVMTIRIDQPFDECIQLKLIHHRNKVVFACQTYPKIIAMTWARWIGAVSLLAAATLSAWVDPDEAFIGKRRSYWAFQKPVRPEVPAGVSPVDFLNGKKSTEKLPAAQLLRRVTLDLTGLPPNRVEVDAFLRDRSPDAYDKVVDRLMASPRYGERWAQRWLDVVRYADTNGYELDEERPQAWRYRDYVVASFNSDKPFDRFIREQVAGDELYPGDRQALIATGFHRAGPIHLVSGNQDEDMNRQEVLTEMSGAIGSVFLGITVGCARCHNHKFDPILQADYYRLQAIHAATEYKDIDVATESEKAEYEKAEKAYKARIEPVQKEITAIEKPYRDRIRAERKATIELPLQQALDIPKEKRNEEQKRLAKDAEERINPTWDELLAAIPPKERERRHALRMELHRIELDAPEPPPTAYAVANMKAAPQAYILKIGDPKQKLAPVDPGLPVVLAGHAAYPLAPAGRRAALAEWLTSPDHPLTPRVMVNRIWQFRMGTGIVATPNDFGALGARPSNQKLLDWLATEFVARKWSVKAIDRLIVTSQAYRLSGQRRRLEGEEIRDSVLAVSGVLNLKMGGRPVRVPIEKEIYDIIFTEHEPDNLWPLAADKTEQYRRSLYLLNKRTVRLPLLANFDQPDAMSSCPERPTSTHALQALTLINSDFMHEQSALFAARLEKQCGTDRGCQVNQAHKLALARSPKPAELTMAKAFFASGGTLPQFCLAMLNRNEFVYLP